MKKPEKLTLWDKNGFYRDEYSKEALEDRRRREYDERVQEERKPKRGW